MDSRQQYRLSNFCLVTESFTFMAGTHSFPALESWYSLEEDRGRSEQRAATQQEISRSAFPNLLPVHTSHTLLHNPSDLLEYVGVFLINPMGQVPAVIQDLENRQEKSMEQSGLPLGKALAGDKTGKKRWRASSGMDGGLFGQRSWGQDSWVPLVASSSGTPPKHRGFLTPCVGADGS